MTINKYGPRVPVIKLVNEYNGTPESVESLNKRILDRARLNAVTQGGIDFIPVNILNVNSTDEEPIWDKVTLNVSTGEISPYGEKEEN
jgi:hypothetical protein